MYGFLTSSSIHSNPVLLIKNTEIMKLNWSVGIALELSYTCLQALKLVGCFWIAI